MILDSDDHPQADGLCLMGKNHYNDSNPLMSQDAENALPANAFTDNINEDDLSPLDTFISIQDLIAREGEDRLRAEFILNQFIPKSNRTAPVSTIARKQGINKASATTRPLNTGMRVPISSSTIKAPFIVDDDQDEEEEVSNSNTKRGGTWRRGKFAYKRKTF